MLMQHCGSTQTYFFPRFPHTAYAFKIALGKVLFDYKGLRMHKLCYQVLQSSSQNYVSSSLFGVLNRAVNYRALPRFSVMAGNTSTSSLNDDVTLDSDPQRTYQVVVAATRNMGIGKDGKLPWNLPSDLKFFKELTTSTVDPVKKNALVMGRKTWESIPLNYRPLPRRLNIVVTRSGSLGIDTAVNVVLCGSISSTMKLLAQPPYSESIEKVFVIGGGQILKEALNAPQCDAIHITEVETSIDCDTFIPPVDFATFRPWYSSLPLVENNIQFSFVTYARVRSSIIEHHTSSSGVKSSCSSNSNKFEVESFDFLPKMIFERHEENLYLRLIQAIISSGTMKDERTGSGTLSRFRCQMRFNLRRSFPLLTTKRVSWQGVVEKVLWFISGSTNAKVLQENGIRMWNGNSFRDYLDSIGLSDREEETWDPFVDSSGETLVPGIGSDQLSDVVDKIKNGVDDKFIIFSSWNPSDLELMAPPTYDTFIKFCVDNGELSCQMHQHSADMGLIVPFNIACYALLTCLIAHVCGFTPGDFIHINGDAHVNRTHIRPLQEQLHKRPKPFPILEINPKKKDIYTLEAADFALTGYDPHE